MVGFSLSTLKKYVFRNGMIFQGDIISSNFHVQTCRYLKHPALPYCLCSEAPSTTNSVQIHIALLPKPDRHVAIVQLKTLHHQAPHSSHQPHQPHQFVPISISIFIHRCHHHHYCHQPFSFRGLNLDGPLFTK